MNDLKNIFSNAQSSGAKSIDFISRHRTVIVILVVCFAVIAALLQTQSYLNPTRNEDKYTEVITSVNPKKIDQEIVAKLEETQNDQNSSVDSSFVPDRNNPFAE
jgi:cell division protein YceG involved in septum cleavage